MRHVIVECVVEIFAPLCNASFLPLLLGVRPVKCGELSSCGLSLWREIISHGELQNRNMIVRRCPARAAR
jgi:hypothetical protein